MRPIEKIINNKGINLNLKIKLELLESHFFYVQKLSKKTKKYENDKKVCYLLFQHKREYYLIAPYIKDNVVKYVLYYDYKENFNHDKIKNKSLSGDMQVNFLKTSNYTSGKTLNECINTLKQMIKSNY